MPRYVILEHDHPHLHWDFMLETGDVLRNWRLSKLPQLNVTIDATASFNHRLLYLDYEGPVSGDRGTVRRWDRGTFEHVEQSGDHVIVRIVGARLSGLVELRRTSAEEWTFVLRPLC